VLNGLYAQPVLINENTKFWSLNGGLATSDILVDGASFGLVIEPRFDLFPNINLMIGSKNGINYSTDGIISLETQVYLRWNFWQPVIFGFSTDVFIQGGVGFLGALNGPDRPFDVRDSRSSLLGDLTAGITIPLSSRWQIEPSFRFGYPFIIGFAVTAGLKFPFNTTRIETRTETVIETRFETRPEVRVETITEAGVETIIETRVEYVEVVRMPPAEEIIKRIMITQVEYIIFGADSFVFNQGIDADARALNELVIGQTARVLTGNPNLKIRIEGHANPVTHEITEIQELAILSENRANEVARLLRARGVREDQIIVVAYGGERAIASDRDHWNINRRVELIVIQVNVD
jgi:outer membrane protein OmpA-like peptidoglycan-associated protein